MAVDLSRSDLIAAVFGAGTMGRGIAQVCAQAGLTVLLFDSCDGAVNDAKSAIDRGLEGLVSKGRMTGDAKRGVLERLKPISSYDEAKDAGIVIEAIVEELAAKRELFRELEKRLAPDAVLATNTSSLSVTEIAAGCERPGRVGGLHFFNPPPLMRLVEVIGGLRSDPTLVEVLVGLCPLAELQFRLGDVEAAVATIEEAIALEPGESYYTEQRRRFLGERSDRPPPPGPFWRPVPSEPPKEEPGITA